MRILRTIVLLAAAAVFMPSPPQEKLATQGANDPPVTELVSAAVSTVADVSDFCGRQPTVCDTAHYLAVTLEGKAKYSIELLYEWAQESRHAGSGQTIAAEEPDSAARSTLRLDDIIPEWRAPARQS